MSRLGAHRDRSQSDETFFPVVFSLQVSRKLHNYYLYLNFLFENVALPIITKIFSKIHHVPNKIATFFVNIPHFCRYAKSVPVTVLNFWGYPGWHAASLTKPDTWNTLSIPGLRPLRTVPT